VKRSFPVGAPVVTFVAKIILSVSVERGRYFDTDQLKHQIVEADTENPWIVVFDGRTVQGFIPIDEISIDELHEDTRYEVEIWPYLPVHLNQVHAYNRYANQLAVNLAKRLNREDGIGFVGAVIELESNECRCETSNS
jgi:hypothetical protein